jgi:acetoacetate decarboxylase
MFAHIGNPPFNTALRAAASTMQSKPPTRFDGVTTRVFPLRANMNRLSAFCEAYLNVAPHVTRFRPAMPYVWLMAMDYGKMSVQAGNLGWVAQHEIAFAVPLEWHRPDGSVGQALVCPFIFVDDEMSLSTGRQVYGWPKTMAWLTPGVNPWISDPGARPPLMQMSTMVYPELYAGKRQEPRILLEIQERATPMFSRVPFRVDGALDVVPRAAQAYLDMLGDFTQMMARPPILGWPRGRGMGALRDAQQLTQTLMDALTRTPTTSHITLKQFRDAEKPMQICYQALIDSEMRVERFNGGGLLGEARLAAGDPSGGHRILLRRYPAEPIVESLGLEVTEEIAIDKTGVSVLQPVFPFWVGVDLTYGVGNPICWRAGDGPWHAESSEATWHAPPAAKSSGRPARERAFNTTLGAALQDVTGPFEFPNVTIRVLPLMADKLRLEAFCTSYLENPYFTFEPWGSYVYMVTSTYEEMTSATDAIGWWADREVAFLIPVKRRGAGGLLLGVGFVPAFTFANTTTAAITGSEVNGKPTFRAKIESPPVAWLTSCGAGESIPQSLLTLETMILPALGFGQKAEERLLLEVRRSHGLPHDPNLRGQVIEHWAHRLRKDNDEKVQAKKDHPHELCVARLLALGVLTDNRRINSFTLKQFRDSADPDRACYQAIVQGRQVINRIWDLREIAPVLNVHIHRYPNMPIAELLGLRRMHTEMQGRVPVDVVQAIRPFWMHVSLREDPAKNVCWRAGSDQWSVRRNEDGFFAPNVELSGGNLKLDFDDAARLIQLGFWDDDVKQWVPEKGASYTRDDARRAIEAIDPQVVLESILSSDRTIYRILADGTKADFWVRCDWLDPCSGIAEAKYFPPQMRTRDGHWYSRELEGQPPLVSKDVAKAPSRSTSS